MLVDKTIKVEKETDELVSQLVTVVKSLKSGQSPVDVILAELLKLQQTINDVKALSANYEESFAGTLKAILLNAADLAAVLLGKDVATT